MKTKDFTPKETSPTVIAANGKNVCNCRNILDAKMIVEMANLKHTLK